LGAVKTPINFRAFVNNVKNEILKIKDLGRRKQLLEGFEAFIEPYKKVGNISATKLQQYKEAWAEFLPDAVYKGKPIASSLKAVKDIAAKQARTTIYDLIGADGKLAYLDYGNLQSIIAAGSKSITSDMAKKSLGRSLWQFIMDKTVTPIATFSGKVLYRTGEGLEFIGNRGAKTVADIIGR